MKIFMYIVIGALLGWFILPILAFLFWVVVALFVIQFVFQIICMLVVMFIISKEKDNA
tara:strand:- start:326 stop:499 length:174 start_codon:yes stop_codon:yes gene_type:complete